MSDNDAPPIDPQKKFFRRARSYGFLLAAMALVGTMLTYWLVNLAFQNMYSDISPQAHADFQRVLIFTAGMFSTSCSGLVWLLGLYDSNETTFIERSKRIHYILAIVSIIVLAIAMLLLQVVRTFNHSLPST